MSGKAFQVHCNGMEGRLHGEDEQCGVEEVESLTVFPSQLYKNIYMPYALPVGNQ